MGLPRRARLHRIKAALAPLAIRRCTVHGAVVVVGAATSPQLTDPDPETRTRYDPPHLRAPPAERMVISGNQRCFFSSCTDLVLRHPESARVVLLDGLLKRSGVPSRESHPTSFSHCAHTAHFRSRGLWRGRRRFVVRSPLPCARAPPRCHDGRNLPAPLPDVLVPTQHILEYLAARETPGSLIVLVLRIPPTMHLSGYEGPTAATVPCTCSRQPLLGTPHSEAIRLRCVANIASRRLPPVHVVAAIPGCALMENHVRLFVSSAGARLCW